jgi:hypothetical protein
MAQVTHKIFSQDVEVGYLTKTTRGNYIIHCFNFSALYERYKNSPYPKYHTANQMILTFKDIADCLNSIPTEYSVIRIDEVDSYLNPKAKEVYTKPLIATSQDNDDEVVLLNAIKADFKNAPTDKLNELYLLLDAELKYRNRKEKILNESGLFLSWLENFNLGHS